MNTQRTGDGEAGARCILLVDDDEELRHALCRLLKRAGYEVFEAGDAESALECLARERLDLVLTDLRLPRRTGLELIAEVHRVRPAIPVLLHTANGDAGTEEAARTLGVFRMLTKPTLRAELLSAIVAALMAAC